MLSASLPPGTKLGPYEVVAALGAGGMGAVYRARDAKLKRDVAIKVLPDELSNNGAALTRFQREAETLASLSHPNIGAIYDLLDVDGSRLLILELIEGEGLDERLLRGPIPLEDALPIARQIAEGLEAAHEKGVTHRDLKPANIRITPSGVVKVLDFGLAKSQAAQSDVGLSTTPTFAATTMPGMILGTPAYMPPEQAKGRETDRTADIWAFGCVFYEMLVGRPAFEGDTVSEILAEVLKSEPQWHRLPPNTPRSIRQLLKRCLRKDSKMRLRDIGDARLEIADVQNSPELETAPAVAAPAASRLKERLAWALAVVALLSALIASRFATAPATANEMRVDIATGPTYNPFMIAISPDGQKIVYVADFQGHSQLWLRRLDASEAKPLPGTDSALGPFWSPDSHNLGFFADAKLKKIDIERGGIQVLANAVNPRGGTWNKNDVILFAPVSPGVIYRIPAAGGKIEAVTQIDASQAQYLLHVYPEFLPDGDHFLYYVGGSPATQGVYVSSLSAPNPTRLVEADSSAVYGAGHLLFLQKGVLLALAFDPKQLKVSGAAIPVVDHMSSSQYRAPIAASASGAVVYRTDARATAAGVPVHGAWFDRTGKEVSNIGGAIAGHWSLSADDKSFVTERTTNGNIDIWRIDTSRGLLSQVTMDPAADTFPTWSPDGEHVIFTSNRKGVTYDLYVGSVNKPGGEELLLSSLENKIATDWSTNKKFVMYRNLSPDTGYDLWALPLKDDGTKNGEPILVARTPGDERDGQFSPDGNWVAYQSNESGSFEIYVQPFPGPGPKFQVSRAGGAQVRWNPNGKELFYIAPDARLMSVSMRLDATGKSFEAGNPMPLFMTDLRGSEVQTPNRQQYAISTDGLRILTRSGAPSPNTVPLTLLLNWKPKAAQ
jgi:Tol biopolymer transport system component/tRNA A-37 threonylcarbamoyl transferase component Bud32